MTLDKEMIKSPQMWQLLMEPVASSLHVMAFSPFEHHALISGDIPLDATMPALSAFQEAVYSNSLLTSDFRSVTVLLPQERFLVIPSEGELSEDAALEAFGKAFPAPNPEGTGGQLLTEHLQGLHCSVAMEVDKEFLNFLRRTFNNPRITHTLAPQALYFNTGNRLRTRGKMFVNLHDSRADVVVLGQGAPLLLNSYKVRDPRDALYYVMAARTAFSIDDTEEIIIAGEPEARTAVSGLLRRHVRYVMPAIVPSAMFKAGRAALRTPFELIVAPLV